jgi:hypothetical protein
MELFLNLCWLSLLLPAYLLWRQRTAADRPAESPAAHPLVFVCALGCALILLFPVISASDDLHAMRPEMEESERASRHAGHCTCTSHAPAHAAQPVLPNATSLTPEITQIGTVLPFAPHKYAGFSTHAPASRAPPLGLRASV